MLNRSLSSLPDRDEEKTVASPVAILVHVRKARGKEKVNSKPLEGVKRVAGRRLDSIVVNTEPISIRSCHLDSPMSK